MDRREAQEGLDPCHDDIGRPRRQTASTRDPLWYAGYLCGRHLAIFRDRSQQSTTRQFATINHDAKEVQAASPLPAEASGSSPDAPTHDKPAAPDSANVDHHQDHHQAPTTNIKNKKHSDKSASMGDGPDQSERARDARVSGKGKLKGTDGGEADGKAGGLRADQGGMRAPNASARGKGTAAHGMKGGTGSNSAMGIPSGWGLIPLINVPASLRHLTDTLLIMKDANPGQLAANAMSKITSRTTIYRLRKNIALDASKYADGRIAAHIDEINAATAKMTKQEQTQAFNRWRWEIQRQYVARVEKGASSKLKKGGLSTIDKNNAEKVLEATKVKPVAGQLPRNHKFAGKEFPSNRLPSEYQRTGLRFTEDGFPDFGPYAQQLPNGRKSTQIRFSGNYDRDAARAKIAAGYKPSDEISDHLTWHHHQDGRTMVLVPKKLHGAVRHTGGRGTYKHATGDPTVYP